MSGLMDTGQTAELDDLGVRAFLTKPFSAEKLLSTISDVLSES
jgi:DNA-binding response OmpR family regulator